MKFNRIFGLIMSLAIISFLSSCQKEEAIVAENTSYDLNELKVTEQGVIQFNSAEEFTSALANIKELNGEQLIEWENTIGLDSYQNQREQAWVALENAANQNELDEVMAIYGDFFKIETVDGEIHYDDAVRINSLLKLCNSNGIVFIGGNVVRVVNDYILNSDKSLLNEVLEYSYEDVINGEISKEIKNKKYIETLYNDTQILKNSSSTTQEIERHNAVNGDREAWINVKCEIDRYDIFVLGLGWIRHTDMKSKIHAWGKKKLWWGWTKYTTTVTVNGVNNGTDIIMNTPNGILNFDIGTQSKYTRDFHITLIDAIVPADLPGAFNFSRIDVRTKTTGTNGHWATINFN